MACSVLLSAQLFSSLAKMCAHDSGESPLVQFAAASPKLFAQLTAFLEPAERANLICCCRALASASTSPVALGHLLLKAVSLRSLPLRLTHLRTCKALDSFTDDEVSQCVSTLLKHGAQPRTVTQSDSQGGQHDVAWLVQRGYTRTLALLVKQRPECAALMKDDETLKAGVRSNKEFTLLFLTARGAKFEPKLDQLTTEAIRCGASKSLLWLAQWPDEMTPKKLLTHLQDGLPDPRTVSCSDVSATLEVLLLHGLSANCTVKCTAQGGPPTATDAGTEHSLLEWAVLYACAAAKLQETTRHARRSRRVSTQGSPTHAKHNTPQQSQEPRKSEDYSFKRAVAVAQEAAGESTPAHTRRRSGNGATHSDDTQGGVTVQDEVQAGRELVRVAITHGATVNAGKGGALQLAAQGLRSDLVTDLVSRGADVTLPRITHQGQQTDLLRWAANTAACPADSGVLQALLQGMKAAAAPASTPPSVSGHNTPRPGSPQPSANGAATTGHGTTAQGGKGKSSVASKVTNKAKEATPPDTPPRTTNTHTNANTTTDTRAPRSAAADTPTPGSPTRLVTASGLTPMVTLGGQAALQTKASDEEGVGGETGPGQGAGKGAGKGCLLSASLVSELQRDAALLDAVLRNDIQVVECLLEAGADIHTRQDKALLLALGAIDNNNPDNWMPRPRDRAPVLSASRPLVALLLKHGADINARQGWAIRQAARWRDTYSIKYLTDLGADRSWLEKDPAVANLNL